MIKLLKNSILKIVDVLEMIIGALLVISIAILMIFLAKDLQVVFLSGNQEETFNTFLASAFNLVIGIEFIKMLCKHSPGTVVEVLLFAIARQLIIEHTSTLDNLVGIFSIAVLFAIRKYLFYTFDEVEKTIYRSNERIKRINILEHIDIPGEKSDTLEDVVLREIEERKLEFGTGTCIYYAGFALKIAKVNDENKITRIEVIKSIK